MFDTLVLEKSWQYDSTAFRQMMDELELMAEKKGDIGLKLEIILGRYWRTDAENTTDFDAKIAHMEQLLKEINAREYPEYHAIFRFELGNNYLGKKQNYLAAFENYLSAYNIIRQLNDKNFPDKKLILTGIGNAYYRIGDYGNCKKILLKAEATKPGRVNMFNYNSKNTLGLAYRELGAYDSAIYYFKQAATLAADAKDTAWIGITNGNIGITYYLQHKYDQAIPLLEQDIAICIRTGNSAYDNGVNSALIMANIYLDKNNPGMATKYLSVAEQYLPETRDKVMLYSKYYPAKARYSYLIGNAALAYHFQDSAAYYRDSISSRRKIFDLSRLQIKHETEKNAAELIQLKAEKKHFVFVRNTLIAGVTLIFIAGFLFIARQRLRHRLKQNELLAQQKIAEQELANAAKELEVFTRYLQHKNALIEQSTREIERLQHNLDNFHKSDINNDVLQQLYASTILTDEEWEDFKQLFEQVHKGYLQRLKDKMPDLSPADTRFVVLSKLKLSNKEMAGILGVQPDTIRTYKHRLRKKYDLPDDNTLNDFVNNI